jgi:probable F420-dependent oxidoreductase
MDIGIGMNSHGLMTREGEDSFVRSIPASEMRTLELCRLAEQLGYHSLWFGDHVVMDRDRGEIHPANASGRRAHPDRCVILDPITALAAAAAATTTIGLASSVLIAPYRHPLTVAHAFATIDQLSGGRLMMGVGAGWLKNEFDALGVPLEEAGARTDECLRVYRAAWEQDYPEFHGRFYDFAEISVEPKPAHRIPIWYGAVTPAGARRAVRHADGLYPMLLDTAAEPSRHDHLRDVVRAEAEKRGRDLTGFKQLVFTTGVVTDSDDPLARASKRWLLTGTADQVLEDLEALAQHGYSHATIFFDVRSGTVSELIEIMERFAEEVLPHTGAIQAAGW